jgi:osmotically inducible protein OsmC
MTQRENIQYTVKSHTTGGRDHGQSRSEDGRLDIELSVPGTGGIGTNPEQLLAAGWSACFVSSIKFVASQRKTVLPDNLAVDVDVDLCRNIGGYFLQARIGIIMPGMEYELAHRLVHEAHLICPYSKAICGNISVAIGVSTAQTKSILLPVHTQSDL